MNLARFITAEVPELTDEEAADLLTLRREYGISAREAWTELPAWEVQLLVAAARPMDIEDVEPEGDPFDAPPSNIDKLLKRGE